MYKVPGRSIMCDSFGSWIKEIVWCYVVIKIWKNAVELDKTIYGKDVCPWCGEKYKYIYSEPMVTNVKDDFVVV
jgi:hypothetical protein